MSPNFDFDAETLRRLAGEHRLADAGALVRQTLARTLGDAAERRPVRWAQAAASARRESARTNGLPAAVQEMLQRLSALKPGSALCETTLPGRTSPTTVVPDGARFEERVHRGAGGSLAYKLYVPSTAGSRAMPLVVMLHGCTQSPDDFAAGTRMNEVAEEQGFLVAYPRQSQSANVQKCWNWFEAKDQRRDGGEPALIAGLTREILRDERVDPARVYVAGLSAGGAAAAIMGQTYPDLYTAVGVHSGLAAGAATDMPSAFAAMRQGGHPGGVGVPVPTIVFHGDCDHTVHPANGEQVLTQAGADGCLAINVVHGTAPGGLAYTRTTHADESGRTMHEHWIMHGAGHAWSGGSAAGSYTEPRGPDSSREMMRFFRQHAAITL